MSLAALSALMFKKKVEAGEYATESVPCFCGSSLYREVANQDRYGFKHTMCLCEECGLLYANPRMTQEAYDKFYSTHYRDIYGAGQGVYEFGGKEHSFENTKKHILDIVEDYEMPEPKVVFEIGCGDGSALDLFDDCVTIGVDLDKNAVERGKARNRNLIYGDIEKLEEFGKKADLIILNHVVEHFLNLKKELMRIRSLLTDDGVIYLAVPGLYCWDRDTIFQNAHTYQFTGNTIDYVMQSCGFEELFLNENIESIWRKGPFVDDSNPDESPSIIKFLTCTDSKHFIPRVRVSNKFSLKERRHNLKYAVESGVPQITKLVNIHPDSKAILICGGPTIEDYVDKIKELQDNGAKIYCIERMHHWCVTNEITPDYVIAMDASDDVIESFDEVTLSQDGVTYILMAQCKPEIFDAVKGKDAYYFLVPQKGIDIKKFFKKKDLKNITWINPAGSVSLGALAIAITLGARSFHIFGFDCHVDEKSYAEGITGVGNVTHTIEVEINDRTFKTTPAYMAFMQHFFGLYKIGTDLKQIKSVKIYGDSMVKAAAKFNLEPGGKMGLLKRTSPASQVTSIAVKTCSKCAEYENLLNEVRRVIKSQKIGRRDKNERIALLLK